MAQNLFQHAQDVVMAEETSKLFLNKSINEVTIKDIANHIGVGEATIYRHFDTKYNIVLGVAQYLQTKILSQYYNVSNCNSGFEKIERFYKSFLFIYKDNPRYYKFINEFDAFVLTNKSGSMSSYEEGIDKFKDIFFECYECGLKDKTIKPVDNVENFYYATTHALMGLCKKLADKDIIAQDKTLDKGREIEVLIDTILYRLK